MNIWIVTIGEQLPKIDGKNIRTWRSVMLSNELLKKGHSVVRWTSTFDHSRKIHRFEETTEINSEKNYKLVFLKSSGYEKNISFKRIKDHILLGKLFKEAILKYPKPDVILCSLPILELCEEATLYGKKNNIPVVLDARDMWPDIFEEALPKILRPLAKVLLYPMYRKVRNSCKNATALSGISEPYILWLLNYANRKRKGYDRYFPMAYSERVPEKNAIANADTYWDLLGVSKNEFNICLFASFENGFDIDTVIESAKILLNNNSCIKFVLCGDGSRLNEYRLKSKNYKNILFPGWVDGDKIWTLMRRSSVGLLPYWNKPNFLLNIPNKPIEYLSAGLPLVSSLRGVIGDYITANNCGVFYSSPNELAEKLNFLQKNNDIRENMSINAFNLFKKEFVSEKVYSDMADYLLEIAENHNSNII